MEICFYILQILFWGSVAGILHTYGIYPLLMRSLRQRKGLDRQVYSSHDDDWPILHVVMAMYNEEAVIRQTLESIVNSDYPKEKLKVHIGSDNSTDKSHEIVQSIIADNDPFVNLEIFAGRCGKIKIINRLIDKIPHGDGSVLLLCDANVVWSETLARKLASHFKDDRIGIVASTVIDQDTSKKGIAAEEEAYVNGENLVKYAEGKLFGRMMGAFGACYALRRSIYEPVPEHFNVDDFYETMVCYERGYDGIVDLNAICYESVSEEISEEFRRKKRISKGNFQNLKRFFSYLLPWNCGMPTFLLFWSHKGLRWFGPLLIGIIFGTGIALAFTSHWIYQLGAAGLLTSLLMVAIDKVMDCLNSPRRIRLCKFSRYFYSMNFALFLGGLEFCKGVSNSVWEPTKRVPIRSVSGE